MRRGNRYVVARPLCSVVTTPSTPSVSRDAAVCNRQSSRGDDPGSAVRRVLRLVASMLARLWRVIRGVHVVCKRVVVVAFVVVMAALKSVFTVVRWLFRLRHMFVRK